jgi:hypothetical protein
MDLDLKGMQKRPTLDPPTQGYGVAGVQRPTLNAT